MVEACNEAVSETGMDGSTNVNVIDGVVVGVQLLIALVTAGFGTGKRGIYSSSEAVRQRRKQDWL